MHNDCIPNPKNWNDKSIYDLATTPEQTSFIRNAQATFRNSNIWTSVTKHGGDIVIQRSDIPLSNQNLTRMKNGYAPFVKNNNGQWVKLELHHVGRTTGQVIEVRSDLHNYNRLTGGTLHIPGSGSPVRESTSSYWKQRYQELNTK